MLAMSVVGAAPFANVNMLSNTTAAAFAAEDTVTFIAGDVTTLPPPPRRPTACATGTSCVSTASFRSPANFLPPWEYTSSDADAFTELTRVLGEKPGSVITSADEGAGYVAATLRYGADDVDDVEFYFTRDGSKTVLFASRSRVNKASPPGCFTRGAKPRSFCLPYTT